MFCANALLDILVTINLIPLPYTSHFSFLILSFSVDFFLKSNQFEKKSKEEFKQILASPKKPTAFSFLPKVKKIEYENQKKKFIRSKSILHFPIRILFLFALSVIWN
ncbi:hypothetical protein LEP1GSC158_2033 [Leptospira interrogans serovar Zanoni str. LT2156]|uniref:Uncharacterized protein n=1 Tax=Leptospira interrogans serovar Zanoni str. LT2156 TaxID=1001601 RepID=M6HC95_LEPIR|nr:hypothetical protein LEP1GSC158_2033 [Leptospira interrogans serovar Zanoni str. LT2156]